MMAWLCIYDGETRNACRILMVNMDTWKTKIDIEG
jgi:hypothetical protein